MKVVMAITGLIMVGFLLMHMYGNLKVFLGADAFNHYAHWLKGDILYPLVPSGTFIWIFRVFLLVAIVAHIWSAAVLTGRAHSARSSKYAVTKRLSQTYAARTMRWGGVILAGFLVFHLLQFTAQVVTTGFRAGSEPYDMVIASFSQWWVTLVYLVWVAIVCLHVRHGVWSALTTLGANTSAKARSFLNGLAWVIAIVLFVGFMIMPLAVQFGWVK
ncbi:succinate dehydrogenase cytochrome b subunit [Propioniciclava sp. MC1683]|nr:succinate dehydrogenase cytochrome b subunit [Propioniciclava sp. MC1683]MBB1501119.1 succinate dehydrogenase cytochrome b subunit [Propioniciclava sp. MC1683]